MEEEETNNVLVFINFSLSNSTVKKNTFISCKVVDFCKQLQSILDIFQFGSWDMFCIKR